MARKICNHPVIPSLRANLTALKITVCPSCLIRRHIFEITEIQTELEHRGGVFNSREAEVGTESDWTQQLACHKALVRRWRVAKIDLHQDLCRLDALRSLDFGKTRWKLQLDKAFDLWREMEVECSRVPGYNCVEVGSDDDASENKPEAEPQVGFEHRLNLEDKIEEVKPKSWRNGNTFSTMPPKNSTADTQEDIYMPVSGSTKKRSGKNNEGWQVVKPKKRSTKRRAVFPKAPHFAQEEGISLDGTSDDHAGSAPLDLDGAALLEMEDTLPRPEPDSHWNGRNRYDLLPEISEDADIVAPHHYNECNPLPPQTPGYSSDIPPSTAPTTPSKSPLQPVLKPKSSRRPASNRQRQKNRVRINHLATVFCEPNDCQGLPPGMRSYARPHFSYTDANNARKMLNFYRSSRRHEPHTWTVSGDYESVNTSWFRLDWGGFDIWQKKRDVEECALPGNKGLGNTKRRVCYFREDSDEEEGGDEEESHNEEEPNGDVPDRLVCKEKDANNSDPTVDVSKE